MRKIIYLILASILPLGIYAQDVPSDNKNSEKNRLANTSHQRTKYKNRKNTRRQTLYFHMEKTA